eukprot:13743795-Alexandrium_andersonii.AAC.1
MQSLVQAPRMQASKIKASPLWSGTFGEWPLAHPFWLSCPASGRCERGFSPSPGPSPPATRPSAPAGTE